MKLRSAGLGKTQLDAFIVAMEKVDDSVLFFVEVTHPTKWHTRMCFQEKDLRKLAILVFKPKNLMFVIKALISPRKIESKIDF